MLSNQTLELIIAAAVLFFILSLSLNRHSLKKRFRASQKRLMMLYAEIDEMHRFLQRQGGTNDPEPLYELIFDTLNDVLAVDSAVIFLLASGSGGEKRRLNLVAHRGIDESLTDLIRSIEFGSNTATERAVDECKPVYRTIADYPEGPLKDLLRAKDGTMVIALPVCTSGKAMGALTIGLRNRHTLKPGDEELLKILSDQVGTVLLNLTLYSSLSESENNYRTIFNLAVESIFVHSLDGVILDANRAAAQRLGYSVDELKGRSCASVESPETSSRSAASVARVVTENQVGFESIHITSGGERIPVGINSSLIQFGGRPAVLSVVRDISRQKETEALLAEAARTDHLTQAENRRAFDERFRDARSPAANAMVIPWRLLLLDVDDFKQVNDSYGHGTGDTVLKGLVKVIAGAIRESDFFARYGGEEFIVALVECSREETLAAAERIRRAVATMRTTVGNEQIGITVSLGISEVIAEDPDPAAAVRRADHALYTAKASGKNRVGLEPGTGPTD